MGHEIKWADSTHLAKPGPAHAYRNFVSVAGNGGHHVLDPLLAHLSGANTDIMQRCEEQRSRPGPGLRVEVDTAESAGCTSDDDVDLTTMYW